MNDLELAIFNLRSNVGRYDKPDRYYRGDHDLAFATEKFENAFGDLFREFALNLCPSICDAVRDKLKINGFTIGARTLLSSTLRRGVTGPSTSPEPSPQTISSAEPCPDDPVHPVSNSAPRFSVSAVNPDIHGALDALWSDNQLDLVAEEIHLEALKLGDSYAIVWPDETGHVTIYPQRAHLCTVVYDDERPGRMRFAAKYWQTCDGLLRLNLFYPDRIEKYVSKSNCGPSLPDASELAPLLTKEGWPRFADGVVLSDVSPSPFLPVSPTVVPNPYGAIPLFHFSNTSEIGTFGKSELQQAIPIQNGLNKAVLDMLVAMEFSAFRQRWISGIEIEYDESGNPIPPFKCGMDRIWMTSNAETTFGDFNTTDLDQFLKVKDSFRVDMAGVTGTPLHYFLQNERGFASAEALSRAEARFLAKVRDRQKAFGMVWARMMSFALQLAGFGPAICLQTRWDDPQPIGERELLENIALKKKLGITTEQALLEAGYGRSDITLMLRSADETLLASQGGLTVDPT